MADNLVIVESPAKARTIERYLGGDFTVLASYGHIRDLPKSDFAVEVQDGGACHLVYEVPASSQKHVAALRKAAREASTIWLAPDLDREGEAIAWHIAEVLGLDHVTTNRVTFDEITRDAIREAFDNPRHLNLDLIDAQQARRAVDRIVGYRLSPVLWRTVASGISAGRVQSVALRLIVDREDEIRAFVAREYWDLTGQFARAEGPADVQGRLHSVGGRRLATPKDLEASETDEARLASLLLVGDEEQAAELERRARTLDYTVREVRRTEANRNPKPPFKTSTLQGEASKIGFSAAQTMRLAQQLYEGIDLGGEQVGLITYMRTDSLNLSKQALAEIGDLVRERYGERYALDQPRRFTTRSKGAQEAHEAVRPTSVLRTPDQVRRRLTAEQHRLYELIWKRTVATQMAPAVFDRVSADVVGLEPDGEPTTAAAAMGGEPPNGSGSPQRGERAAATTAAAAMGGEHEEFLFRVTGQVERFDGWMRAYRAVRDEDEVADEVSDRLPALEEGQRLRLADLVAEQHFTNPPPRYSERTLVETLEDLGIGRPSTYASIIQTLEYRDYVDKEGRRFFATPLGEVVVSFLKAHFAEVVDVGFTARMESTLDEIAAGEEAWCQTVTRFLGEVDDWVRERKPERPRLPLLHPADCPVCGAPMERVFSGKSKQWFASCSRWPECEGTLPLEPDGTVGEPEPEPEPDETVRCPECGNPMLLREGRYGRFYGCVDYPRCKGIRNVSRRLVYCDEHGEVQAFRSPTDPGSHMELRTSRYGKPFVGSTGYPDDQFAVWSVPIATPCPECGSPLRPPPRNRKQPVAICTHPDVVHVFELEDFDVPEVATMVVVPGVEAYDPELGGQPLEPLGEVPGPIPMTYTGSQDPPKSKGRKKSRKQKARGSRQDRAS